MSLSNLIKPVHYVTVEDTLVIEPAPYQWRAPSSPPAQSEADAEAAKRQVELDEWTEMKNRILRDAEELAEQRIREAMDEAERRRAEADAEIRAWWEESRGRDADARQEAFAEGREAGYREGIAEAEAAVRQQYAEQLEEARQVLDSAYDQKRHIIREAEPFLIDLGTAVAEKIVQRQLTVEPDWILALTKSMLSRKREKGAITLCVAPSNFSFFQDARDELVLAVDSQAELHIVPDATVQDQGCVIRTEFGSVDARIDTQLQEIKQALLHVALSEDEDDGPAAS